MSRYSIRTSDAGPRPVPSDAGPFLTEGAAWTECLALVDAALSDASAKSARAEDEACRNVADIDGATMRAEKAHALLQRRCREWTETARAFRAWQATDARP